MLNRARKSEMLAWQFSWMFDMLDAFGRQMHVEQAVVASLESDEVSLVQLDSDKLHDVLVNRKSEGHCVRVRVRSSAFYLVYAVQILQQHDSQRNRGAWMSCNVGRRRACLTAPLF